MPLIMSLKKGFKRFNAFTRMFEVRPPLARAHVIKSARDDACATKFDESRRPVGTLNPLRYSYKNKDKRSGGRTGGTP